MVGGAEPLGLEAESVNSDDADRCLADTPEVLADRLLPSVTFVPCVLLGLDVLALVRF